MRIKIGWDNGVNRGPGDACVWMAASCVRPRDETSFVGGDLSEGPLHAVWPRHG